MRAYSRNKKLSKRNSLKRRRVRKVRSNKRGGSCGCLKKTKNQKPKKQNTNKTKVMRTKRKLSKQRGGNLTTPSITQCSSNSSSLSNSNELLFDQSFSFENNTNTNTNNTLPPSCHFVGLNGEGTSAYSCV
jgi:hypothetical protein